MNGVPARPTPPEPSTTGDLLERQDLLERIDLLLGALIRGESRAVVIEGGLGAGKSALLREIGDRARTRVTTLVARCAPEEANEEHGTLRQLLDGLPGSAHEDLTACLAGRDPLMMLVDDVQWADAESLGFLAHLLRRLHSVSLLLVVTLDQQEPSPRWPDLATMVHDPAADVWHLRPLSPAAIGVLCRRALGPGHEAVARECGDLTGGVPYFVAEFLSEAVRMRDSGGEPLEAMTRPGASPTVAAIALGRVTRHDPGLAQILKRLVVVSDPVPIACLAHALDRSQADTADAVETLRRLSLVMAEERVTVAPPLLRLAVLGTLSPSERHEAETRLAHALIASGGENAAAAVHLLATYPSGVPEHVAVLRSAAKAAAAQGLAVAAGAYLRRALCEPPSPAARSEVLVDLGLIELQYDQAAALDHLRAGLDCEADPQARVGAVLGLAKAFLLDARCAEAAAVVEAELACTSLPADHHLVRRMQAELLFVSLGDGAVFQKTYPRHPVPDNARADWDSAGDAEGSRTTLAARALHDALSGRPCGPVLDDISLALNGSPSPCLESGLGLLLGGLVLVWGDELDAAGRFYTEAQSWPLCSGSSLLRSTATWMRGLVELRRGHLEPASEFIGAARRISSADGGEHWSFAPLIAAADLAVDRGDVPELLAQTGGRESGDPGPLLLAHIWLARRGHLRVASGDVRRGLDDLEEAGRRLVAIGCLNPAVAPWRSDAAMAMRRLGQAEDGYPLVEEEVHLATRWGSPRPLAIALRRRALLRPREALEDLTESLRLLDLAGMPIERARTMLALGRSHRLSRSLVKARAVLSEARSLTLGGGAPGLLRRIDDELLMAGGRPRLRGGADGGTPLTAGEDRVARLAAAGQTNEQIARELFVARRTVEIHLTSVYRKLHIRGRVALPDALRALPQLDSQPAR